ncbi:hypothetical protein B0H12DRAFT_757691 [Mycena haematopus]|nr:hypothetical protein B0H12DRAFT_757691 [Mycena haematopus]
MDQLLISQFEPFHRLTHRELLSYGFKPGEPWAEQRRELESAFDRAGRSDHSGLSNRSLSMSSGLPLTSRAPVAQRQHSTSSAGYGSARYSGYGSNHLHRPEYAAPSGRTYSQEAWMMPYRGYDHSSPRSVSSRAASPTPSYASRHNYGHEYAPSSNYHNSTYQSHSQLSRHSGYAYSGSASSTNYTLQTLYDTDDENHTPPSSLTDSELHFTSGYAEASFIIEPSDSGSEASYSGDHSSYADSEAELGDSGSGYSGSESDGAYSEGADDYDYDDAGSYSDEGDYSDDGGYYSD